MWLFDNPWCIIGMVGVAAGLRLWGAQASYLRQVRGTVLEFIDSALIALLLVFCILRPFVVQAYFIPSGSMEDTLLIHDRILVDKSVYFYKEPKVGDIVVFRAPPQAFTGAPKKNDFIKRVVGAPGDRISVHDGALWRNGQPATEPYLKEPPFYQWPEDGSEVIVPNGTLLVMGDNRNLSNDSHKWQLVRYGGKVEAAPFLPRENILGKALVIFWPPTRARLLN